jgi:hypothetical protein
VRGEEEELVVKIDGVGLTEELMVLHWAKQICGV